MFADHFEGVMSLFSEAVAGDFPQNRRLIIQDAVLAHQEKVQPIYANLPNASGWLCRRCSFKACMGPKASLFKDAREANGTAFLSAILEPLLQKNLPISANEKDRKRDDYPLHIVNRHAVLHGESCDYGTRENSARAFSLCGTACSSWTPSLMKNTHK
ncbi:hypothetical protein HORIV_35120 [Vreelandella olivaria]|uniref:Uncharacterized protein n=1 Tax=Vreelandella olivaria TaxID=390919 RepID=A0ABN5X2S0_9GAMM|nr:hypothetical protein HORIV_35120 [Halomonas olivaria]